MIGGTVDSERHPFVGAIDGRQIGRPLTPSGALILPKGASDRRTRHPVLGRRRGEEGPCHVRSRRERVLTVALGHRHTNPTYDPARADDPGDLGVVVFDEPVTGIPPASLPTKALLDQIGPDGLRRTTFTAVGYGVSRTTGGSDGGGTPTLDFKSGGTRKAARLEFVSLTPSWLRLEAHGEGDPCTGCRPPEACRKPASTNPIDGRDPRRRSTDAPRLQPGRARPVPGARALVGDGCAPTPRAGSWSRAADSC